MAVEFKLINGVRHYRTSAKEPWKVDNLSQAEWDNLTKPRVVNMDDIQWGLFEESTPVLKRPAGAKTKSRRKKRKKAWKGVLAWILVLGVAVGLVYNHFGESEEESIVKQYMEMLKGEGENE